MQLTITAHTLTTALGAGINANWVKLCAGETGLRACHFFDIVDLSTWVGEVNDVDSVCVPAELEKFNCRNNRLAFLGLQQDNFLQQAQNATSHYGKERVGVFIGTSTSGIHQTERAYLSRNSVSDSLPAWYHYAETHNTYSVAEFVRCVVGAEGISAAISTACSSSAKVFASAYRAIKSGLCDAAIVGGVDSLCLTTLYGFNSLQLISNEMCRPSDKQRTGISIGEAAGFALLERAGDSTINLMGYGESSDAYHMSSPHPGGEGALLAMQAALDMAGLTPANIDYINLHGTGTTANDLAESIAVNQLFGNLIPCSSTKGWTGHTLGAAGIVEAVFSLLCLNKGFVPQSLNTREKDPQITINIVMENQHKSLRYVLSNSFGFGGSNCSLIFGVQP